MRDNGLPEWAHPDIYERMWTVGELADALRNMEWEPSTVDPTTSYLHDETVEHVDDATGEVVFVTTTEERVGQPLTRYYAWIDPNGEYGPLRLPRDESRRATPGQAACVVYLMSSRAD